MFTLLGAQPLILHVVVPDRLELEHLPCHLHLLDLALHVAISALTLSRSAQLFLRFRCALPYDTVLFLPSFIDLIHRIDLLTRARRRRRFSTLIRRLDNRPSKLLKRTLALDLTALGVYCSSRLFK